MKTKSENANERRKKVYAKPTMTKVRFTEKEKKVGIAGITGAITVVGECGGSCGSGLGGSETITGGVGM